MHQGQSDAQPHCISHDWHETAVNNLLTTGQSDAEPHCVSHDRHTRWVQLSVSC